MNPRIVFGDCETVRLEPGPATVWELALIIRDEGEPDHELVWHIRPDLALADAMALRIGGYYERCKAQELPVGDGYLVYDSGITEAPSGMAMGGPEIARSVAHLLSGAVLAGANMGSFDVPHIDGYLRAHGEALAADYHYLDTGSLVLGWVHGLGSSLPEWPVKLSTAIDVCGLDRSAYTAHEALSDARAVRDIWDVVTGGGDR